MVAFLLYIVAFSGIVLAQYPYGTWDNQYGNETLSCNSTISHANASGIFPFSVDYPLGNVTPQTGHAIQNVPNPAWAITVDKYQDTTQQTVWFDTAGQNYSDDLALGYDVCAYILTDLPENTVRLGQHDPGDCSSMLSAPCRDEILSRMAESAQKWTTYASPPLYSNLSAGILPSICNLIFGDLGEDGKTYPRVCAKEFGYSYDTHDAEAYNRQVNTMETALTGYNDTILDDTACRLHGNGRTFRSLSPSFSTNAGAYDQYTRDVMPALAVWFTVANYERSSYTTWANSTMSCLRVKEFSQVSRVSPALPQGTPYEYGSGGLSGGAIAGIVVGAVVFVAAIAGLGFWLWRRRAKRRDWSKDEAAKAKEKETGLNEFGGDDVHELKSDDRKLEKDSSPINELDGWKRVLELQGSPKGVELQGDSKPVELGA